MNDVVKVKKLKTEDFGFFHPEYQNRTAGLMANASEHVIHRDVQVFFSLSDGNADIRRLATLTSFPYGLCDIRHQSPKA